MVARLLKTLRRSFAIGLVVCIPSGFAAARTPCSDASLKGIHTRSADAPTGSQFANRVEGLNETEREQATESELRAGNMPDFLRTAVPVSLKGTAQDGRALEVVVCVLRDYLSVGSNADFVLMPMRLATALAVGDTYGFTLPTRKIVDAIYNQSEIHLSPQPLPAGNRMRSIGYYLWHNDLIENQRKRLGAQFELIAGHKKDLVLTNKLWQLPDRVAIYGWHRSASAPIQPLSLYHGARYADYSHGARLISTTAYVNGESKSLFAILADPQMAAVVSDEGPIRDTSKLLSILEKPPEYASNAKASH